MWNYVKLTTEQDATHSGWVMIVTWQNAIFAYVSEVASPGLLLTLDVTVPASFATVITFSNSARNEIIDPELT